VSPLDGVNHNLLARIGLSVGLPRVRRERTQDRTELSRSTHNSPLAIRRAFG
jgi:hypothetical protein